VSSDQQVDTAQDPDTGGQQDTADPDGGAGDTSDAGPADTGAADTGAVDIEQDTGTSCPGGPGCDCDGNDDCDGAFCVPFASGKRCAAKCIDTCPDGFRCASVDGGGGDVAQICVPTLDWICDPCTESKTCQSTGLADAFCVDYGDDGAFCGAPCAADGDCPQDYACKQAQSIEGKPVKQCVRKGDGDKPGQCTCSEPATEKSLSTTCYITHKDGGGQLTAKCVGQRTCTKSGLGKCVGPAPEAEACDGKDNDCDGKTDEATCDDNNTCTLDLCDQAAAKIGCVHKKLDGQACDADGSACTEADACDSGICVPGKPKSCDDGNGCTVDACQPATGCTNTDDDGKGCEADGNPCTVGDSCVQGACKTGKPLACDSGDVCTVGKCDPNNGKCVFADTDKLCNDGDPCTLKDACDEGFCKGKLNDCDDGTPCTIDSCAKPGGCAHKPTSVVCDDGDACTSGDFCKAGKCTGAKVDCDDKNPCTKDSCDPTAKGTGKLAGCQHAPLSNTPCDDGNPCSKPDLCKAGKCSGGPSCCACITDKDCHQKGANLCNGMLRCGKTGACTGCYFDKSKAVTCADDGNPCTASACTPATGTCVTKGQADGKLCDADGSVCTQNDACKDSKCAAGTKLPCDDNNSCTADACDPKKGCHHSNLPGTCDDGDACTSGDTCASLAGKWSCKPGTKVECDDKNPCTVESCVKTKGCVKVVDVSVKAPCYSGKAGTKGVGTCVGGFKQCTADGSFGPCKGEVLPAAKEACDGKDDDCDGQTDLGCKAEGFAFKVVDVAAQGGETTGVKLRSGGVAGGASGDKTGVWLGWLRWLGRLAK